MRVPVWLAGLLLACALAAQQPGGNPRGNPYGFPGGGGGDPGRGSSSRAGGVDGLYPASSQRAGFVTGRVLLDDGNVSDQRIEVQRVCGSAVLQDTLADSKGRFVLQTGGGSGFIPDAGTGAGDVAQGSSRAGNADPCEVRAVLPGYRSDMVTLASRHSLDNPDLGVLILHHLARPQGLTLSATTALAPKDAKKAYGRGLEAERHQKVEAAGKEFSKAVGLYPRFAAAWVELGRVDEHRRHAAEARNDYAQAIAADANYGNPYERLFLLDLRESKWREAADTSDHLLHLDPYGFPDAYYANAVANLELHRLDAAEKSARAAADLTGAQAEPRAPYVLGFILAQKGEFAEAAENLKAFLRHAPAGADRTAAEKMLAQVEQQER